MVGGSSDQRTLRPQGCMCPVGHQLPNRGMFRSWGRNRSELPSRLSIPIEDLCVAFDRDLSLREACNAGCQRPSPPLACLAVTYGDQQRFARCCRTERAAVTLSKPFHQHSSAVATMIDPGDLLLFDRAWSTATDSGMESPGKAPVRKWARAVRRSTSNHHQAARRGLLADAARVRGSAIRRR